MPPTPDNSRSQPTPSNHAIPPTTLAVADAVMQYRQLRELTIEELSRIVGALDYDLSPSELRDIEDCVRAVTVDDLVVLAVALDVTPVVLLAHIPIERSGGDDPLATGLPADITHLEVRAWMENKTTLDHDSRLKWCQREVTRLRGLSVHLDDQLRGAQAEVDALSGLAAREAGPAPIIELHDRIREGEYALTQADLALAMAERRLEQLQEG